MKKTIRINEIIFSQIESRYHFLRLRNTSRIYFADSIYPSQITRAIQDSHSTVSFAHAQNLYAVSERVASELDVKLLHISELTTMLGYTKTDITKLLLAVKKKEISCALVGVGGTGSNFLYWMYKMVEWTGKTDIFKKILAYDDDCFDVPNMLRIPFMPKQSQRIQDPKKITMIPQEFHNIAQNNEYRTEKLSEERLDQRVLISKIEKFVVYGAPGIETREELYASKYTFIAATHRDNEYSLVENPEVDNDLMMETYGKINLSKFFLNHLKMTLYFLEHLRDREEPFGKNLLDKNGKQIINIRNNVTIKTGNFEEEFSEELTNGFKAGTKKIKIIDEAIAANIDNIQL